MRRPLNINLNNAKFLWLGRNRISDFRDLASDMAIPLTVRPTKANRPGMHDLTSLVDRYLAAESDLVAAAAPLHEDKQMADRSIGDSRG